MKIYTKQGDSGTTSVYTKEAIKLSKDDIIVECYGTLDELNSHLGLIISLIESSSDSENNTELNNKIEYLQACQHSLFAIGFAISDSDKLEQSSVTELEQHIDRLQADIPVQTSFILPGGSVLASHLHVARTVARRAERLFARLASTSSVSPISMAYLNRLSDFLFVLAGYANHIKGIEELKV